MYIEDWIFNTCWILFGLGFATLIFWKINRSMSNFVKWLRISVGVIGGVFGGAILGTVLQIVVFILCLYPTLAHTLVLDKDLNVIMDTQHADRFNPFGLMPIEGEAYEVKYSERELSGTMLKFRVKAKDPSQPIERTVVFELPKIIQAEGAEQRLLFYKEAEFPAIEGTYPAYSKWVNYKIYNMIASNAIPWSSFNNPYDDAQQEQFNQAIQNYFKADFDRYNLSFQGNVKFKIE